MTREKFVNSSIVQLDLWSALGVAEDVPEEADLPAIWTSLDLALESLSVRAQLTLAGDAIARIAQLIQDRAWLTIKELDQVDNPEGPVMPIGALDRFVRQSMQVRFERFVEAPPVPLRRSQGVTQAEFPDDGRSVVVELDPAALLSALDAELEFVEPQTVEQATSLAYSENVQEWNGRDRAVFRLTVYLIPSVSGTDDGDSNDEREGGQGATINHGADLDSAVAG